MPSDIQWYNVMGEDGVATVEVSPRDRGIISQISTASEPPSYDEVVNQQQVERTQRRIWGSLVVCVSHFCGLHPIRAPYYCSKTECKKLRLWDRLSWFNIGVCALNLLVCVNHLHLRFFSENSDSLWNSNDKARWIQTFVASICPPVVIIVSTLSSPKLDLLIHLFSIEKGDIAQSDNKRRIRKWFTLMFFLNTIFCLVVILQIFQLFFMDYLSHSIIRSDLIDRDFTDVNTPFTFCMRRVLIEIDHRYFGIMSFIVVRIPQVMIMVLAVQLSVMFYENAHSLARKKLTRQRLTDFFEEFHRLETILNQLEATYNQTIMVIVSGMLTLSTVKTYSVIRFLSSTKGRTELSAILFGEKEVDSKGMMNVAALTSTLFGITLNFMWTIGFVVCCVYCNEMSRSSTRILLNKLVSDDAKPTKDQILQKLTNNDWGITMGKFMRMDRSAVVTMVSIVFTVVAVWLQIGSHI